MPKNDDFKALVREAQKADAKINEARKEMDSLKEKLSGFKESLKAKPGKKGFFSGLLEDDDDDDKEKNDDDDAD
jgi:predicted  nucleic acid-binding Zn-ribbon protein